MNPLPYTYLHDNHGNAEGEGHCEDCSATINQPVTAVNVNDLPGKEEGKQHFDDQ